MNSEKSCKNCIHFPCLNEKCNISNTSGCIRFKSVIQSAIEIIDKENNK